MRLSAHPNYPGYDNYCRIKRQGKDVRVFLNGILQDHVVIADDTNHFIIRELPLLDRPTTDTQCLEGYVYLEPYFK